MAKVIGIVVGIVIVIGAWCAFAIYNVNAGNLDPTSTIDVLSARTCLMISGKDPTSDLNAYLFITETWSE